MNDRFASRAADWDTPEKVGMTQTFVDAMLQRIEPQPEWNALEIGAGTGLVGLQIAPLVKKVVFEDTSEAMLSVLKNKLTEDISAQIVYGEVFEYTKKDIDLIFSCMAFHHIPDMDKALNHLYKITSENAIVAVGDIRSEDGSFHRFEPIPHKGFDTGELSKQFENAGFKVEQVDTYNVLKRERIPGKISEYEQFILIARKQ